MPRIKARAGQLIPVNHRQIPKSGTSNAPPVHRADRAADVVEFEGALVGFFVEGAELLGIPRSIAAIYGICFASPEPLGFSEIQGRLEISAGSISQGLRVLQEVGALKVVGTRLDRREFFTPDMKLRNLFLHYMEHRLQPQLESGHGRLQEIAKSVPRRRDGTAKVLRERLKALQNWHDKTRALMPIAKTFLKLT